MRTLCVLFFTSAALMAHDGSHESSLATALHYALDLRHLGWGLPLICAVVYFLRRRARFAQAQASRAQASRAQAVKRR